jgi:CO/xanthine dehydrogenase Mo-binding subunit
MTGLLHHSRRGFLAGTGSLVLSFSLLPPDVFAQDAPRLPGDLQNNPMLDAWIRIDPDNKITIFTGKAELGQGTKTALLQVAAEQLDLDPKNVTFVTADTGRTPDEGFTAGSATMSASGTALMNASAQVREILLGLAAAKSGLPMTALSARDAAIHAPDGRSWTYGDLVAEDTLHIRARPNSKLKDAKDYTIVGRSMPRVDIPAKVTGGVAYVHDLRPDGMVHARVVRPPRYGARLRSVDTASIERMPGVLKVVRDGSYLAVVAEKEFQAVRAMRALGAAAQWDMGPDLPASQDAVWSFLKSAPAQIDVIMDQPQGASIRMIEASYARPYFMHASIGPSCALAHMQEGKLTVWSHTQGVFPDRQAIAELLGMAESDVRVIHAEGAGCYGHNGADDAAADAALIARALPGRPVRVQWMRDQEHRWEPYGSAMTATMRGGVDSSGMIVAWDYHFWSQTHATRPGGAGSTIAGWLIEKPFALPTPSFRPSPRGSADRNAVPYYKLANAKVTSHFIATPMPLRISALRSLGGYMNIFSIESFMDELALAAGADPVAFRLKHLADPRAIDVVRLAAEKFGWTAGAQPPANRGYGFAFCRYENQAAYLAVAAEVEVNPATGKVRLVRAVAADDSGQAVNPDAIENQIQGGIIQSSSWTLEEQVRFDSNEIASVDWRTYPILRMPDVPDSIEVHVINRPGQPFLGTGEASQGPAGAAIANAIAHATGKRLRVPPFTPDVVKRALNA